MIQSSRKTQVPKPCYWVWVIKSEMTVYIPEDRGSRILLIRMLCRVHTGHFSRRPENSTHSQLKWEKNEAQLRFNDGKAAALFIQHPSCLIFGFWLKIIRKAIEIFSTRSVLGWKSLLRAHNFTQTNSVRMWRKLPSTQRPWVPLMWLKTSYSSLRTMQRMSPMKLKTHSMCLLSIGWMTSSFIKVDEDSGKLYVPHTPYFRIVMNFLLVNSWIILAFSFCKLEFKTRDHPSELIKTTIIQ